MKRDVEVSETNATGSLISKWLISVIWEEGERTIVLQKYDELRTQIFQERRNDSEFDTACQDAEIRFAEVPQQLLYISWWGLKIVPSLLKENSPQGIPVPIQ